MQASLNSSRLRCVSAPMSYFGLSDDFGTITVTEWNNGLGFDVEYGNEKFSISEKLLQAVSFLTGYMELNIPED